MEKKRKKIIYGLSDEAMGVYAISIVGLPAIEADFIALSNKQQVLLKLDAERKMLFGPVLIPNKEILRIDQSTGEEYLIEFPSETIVLACQEFMKNGHQSDHTIEHQMKIEGLTVVESWIKEGESDKSVHLGMDYPIGTWFVGVKVDNDNAWKKVKDGEVKGFSIEGEFAQLSKDAQVLAAVDNTIKRMENRWNKISNNVHLKKNKRNVLPTAQWLLSEFNIDVKVEDTSKDLSVTFSPAEFKEIIEKANATQLIDLGFRVWESTNALNKDEGAKLPNDMIVMNFPQKYYQIIPNGLDVVDLFGRIEKFKLGESDDDERFGVLPYGILRKESEWR